MKREQRLRRAADFSAVHRRGRSVAGEALALRSLHTGAPISRVGFAVGKRVGKAVVRNRVRRRLRAIIAALPLAPGRDIVISARPPAATRDFWALRAELCGLLQKARLLPLPGPPSSNVAFDATAARWGREERGRRAGEDAGLAPSPTYAGMAESPDPATNPEEPRPHRHGGGAGEGATQP